VQLRMSGGRSGQRMHTDRSGTHRATTGRYLRMEDWALPDLPRHEVRSVRRGGHRETLPQGTRALRERAPGRLALRHCVMCLQMFIAPRK
jgi:hypothetical protein